MTPVLSRYIGTPWKPPRLAAGEESPLRISSEHLETVVYICVDGVDEADTPYLEPIGTGFCVRVPGEGGLDIPFLYIVTARHLIEEPGRERVYIRVRTSKGTYPIPTKKDDWYRSDDTDVAAILLDVATLKKQQVKIAAFDIGGCIGDDYQYRGPPLGERNLIQEGASGEMIPLASYQVGVGDDLFFVGLFTQHPGEGTLLPIARFGHIAAMPVESVRIRAFGGTDIDELAYLAECQSWGGYSGSPAFWYATFIDIGTAKDAGGTSQQMAIERPLGPALLGLVSAHFGIEQRAKTTGDILLDSEGSIRTELNAGIAVITPADAIKRLLERDDLMDERKKIIGRRVRPAATADSARSAPQFTRDTFIRDLRKVTRPVEPPDGASS